MADFCRDCFIRLNQWDQEKAKRLVLSKGNELCEGCGKYKPVVIRIKKRGIFRK